MTYSTDSLYPIYILTTYFNHTALYEYKYSFLQNPMSYVIVAQFESNI